MVTVAIKLLYTSRLLFTQNVLAHIRAQTFFLVLSLIFPPLEMIKFILHTFPDFLEAEREGRGGGGWLVPKNSRQINGLLYH